MYMKNILTIVPKLKTFLYPSYGLQTIFFYLKLDGGAIETVSTYLPSCDIVRTYQMMSMR